MAFSMSRSLAILSKLRRLNINYCAHPNIRNLHLVLSKKLLYCDYGDPSTVMKISEERLKQPKTNEVMVEMLAAPINPADINTIQGVYPKKPCLPATPGNEGVGRVVAVGKEVTSLKLGDLVVPNDINLGTWRSHGVWDAKKWFKVPSNMPVLSAATLTVNPMTAYRMLKDFVELKPGDTVLQNGANSACGQAVIQLCAAWKVNTVNIVRDRPAIEILKCTLRELGATHVLTEDEFRSTCLFNPGGMRPPLLGLNCVGGQSGLEVLKKLAPGGHLVTYGGMSRNPVTVPTSALIFKNIKVVGFWMTRWMEKNRSSPKAKEMQEEVLNLIISGKMRGPLYKLIPFSKYEDALCSAGNPRGYAGDKIILTFCDKIID